MIKQLSHNLTHSTIWHEQRKLRTSGREAQKQLSFFRIVQDINKNPSETAIWLQLRLSEPASRRRACIANNLKKSLRWTELFRYGMAVTRVKTERMERIVLQTGWVSERYLTSLCGNFKSSEYISSAKLSRLFLLVMC